MANPTATIRVMPVAGCCCSAYARAISILRRGVISALKPTLK
jgi:hypothetical protein